LGGGAHPGQPLRLFGAPLRSHQTSDSSTETWCRPDQLSSERRHDARRPRPGPGPARPRRSWAGPPPPGGRCAARTRRLPAKAALVESCTWSRASSGRTNVGAKMRGESGGDQTVSCHAGAGERLRSQERAGAGVACAFEG
jgi:hypothetical protein